MELIRGHSLVCVTGPAGAGKTSLMQAGVIPGLEASNGPWEALVLQPGPRPVTDLARLLVSRLAPEARAELLRDRLLAEPGVLLALLHQRAHQRATQVLLFVDALERICDATSDPGERDAFLACLTHVADSVPGRARVVVAMRADTLAHASAQHGFYLRLSRAMERIAPLTRAGLAQALSQPAAMRGYGFEPPTLADDLADMLASAPRPTLDLQRVALALWHGRDRARRVLGAECLDDEDTLRT